MQDFRQLGISSALQETLKKQHIKIPTPIQQKAIPIILDGKDIVAQAQTGTGKTFAFALPILERLNRKATFIQALILSPTRELAIQITEEINKIKSDDIDVLAAYGGQDVEKQLHHLQKSISIVVATPGRLIDHIKRGTVDLSRLACLVLDEADQMLHIGFLPEIDFIMKQTPKDRQTLLFSATISDEIKKLAKKYTNNGIFITVEKKQGPALTVKQMSIHTPPRVKQAALMTIIKKEQPFMAVVFCRTKRRVSKLYEALRAHHFSCKELHGDLSQGKREQVMKEFRDGKFQLLIATDVAARGLDIDGITHIFNYDIPLDAESYVHRIGRTGRAGSEGAAITFYTSEDRLLLDSIENQLQIKIEKIQLPKKEEGKKEQTVVKKQQNAAGKSTRTSKGRKGTGRSKEKAFSSEKRQEKKQTSISSREKQEEKQQKKMEKPLNKGRNKNATGSAIFKPKKSKKK
ncbi:DEAD/DEAH box helicase [Niallia sp. 03133]|uniref:DEAD/DEAH box helicase n=1 Tax=Niallia sp. 03133 TaxID=3458060 RepID=UPI004044C941